MAIILPGYQIKEQIHEGLRSRVLRGVRESDGERVIIKVHRSERPTLRELSHYRNHYTITRSLDIPGVDRPLALESHGGGFALISEDTGSTSLRDHARRAPRSLDEALSIGVQLARVLEGLHARNVIHKDIKPDNILIEPTTGAVTLTDFSIATLLPRERRDPLRHDALEGTLSHMSPEQTGRMNRWIDHRSDYYSLGVTLYELLTRQLPFQSTDPMELIHAHIAQRPAPPAEVSPAVPAVVSDIVMKLLAKSAEARYQSASGLRADLEECLQHLRSQGTIPAFPLGRRDASDRFFLPDKLYGRDAELSALMAAFERAARGAAEVLLVAGRSGIGKTALVHEVERPIVHRNGHFVSGKFDQLKRDIPFSSLVQAFRDLLRQILTEQGERASAWRARLLSALGNEGRVITDVIPELKLVIGEQPDVPALAPADNQDRWNRLFQRFIRVFAAEEHPLVIFLDDLQWADSASLALIELLMTEPETRCLLVVLAYRDNEVDAAHPLELMVSRASKAGAKVTRVELPPLTLADMSLLLADALRCAPDEALDLTAYVLDKTQGNPFFSHQLVKSLHQDGLIVFDEEARRFRYDLALVRDASGRSNVVELMSERLKRLPAATQAALRLAAAAGSRFDLATLAVVLERSEAEAAEALWPALQEGLLLPTEPYEAAGAAAAYRFLHDRVQQAAYLLIPEAERPRAHLAIGRLLLRSTPPEERDEWLFDIVNQLNIGAGLIEDRAERIELSRLSLRAGLKAKASTAYAAAARYLAAGMELLDARSWDEEYDLAAALHRERAEVEHLEGRFDLAEVLARQAIDRARTPVEKAESYNALIVQYTLGARYADAINAGREALALVGVDLPAEDFEAVRDAEMASIKAAIGDRPIASLYDLPEMTLPEKKVALKLLTTMGPPCYRSHQRLWAVICAKAVSLSLKYGNAPQAAYSHTSYGGLLGYVAHDYRAGEELGELAVRLAEKFRSPSDQSVAWLMVGSSLRHWSSHMRRSSDDYQKAYSVGLDSGNLQYAAYAFGHDMYCRLWQGTPLDQLLGEIAGSLAFSRRRMNRWAIDLLDGGRILASNLAGLTSGPRDFSAEDLGEEELLARCRENKNGQVLCIYRIMKSQVLYLHGELEEALACSLAAEEDILSVATQGLLPSAEHAFIQALILAALHGEREGEERARFLDKIVAHAQLLATWSESCPENFLHMHRLVSAELARISGRALEALDLYDLAIDSARRGGFVQDAAVAAELAAKLWIRRGKERLARPYLREASADYVRWGAVTKVKQLEAAYSGSFGDAPAPPRAAPLGTMSASSPAELLDLTTVLKASQAIFSEIVLNKLLATLLRITMENAGADRGFILLPSGGELVVEVSMDASDGELSLREGAPAQRSDALSWGIVEHVARTGEAVVLDDAAASEAYAGDPYVAARGPRSLLCMPAANHGKLVAIVYLENSLSAGCFSAARLETARVLLKQAAIAVENALLYADVQRATEEARRARDHLEIEVAERTAELRQANDRLERELSERARAEEQREALQREVIEGQRARLAELSTPLIPITDDIVVMPLIGTMDAQRAQQTLEAALRGAQAARARAVILDITGLRHMDAGVVSTLIRTASALRLLGMQAILTGMRPEMAQALAGLEADLSGIVSCATVQRGIAHAMGRPKAAAR